MWTSIDQKHLYICPSWPSKTNGIKALTVPCQKLSPCIKQNKFWKKMMQVLLGSWPFAPLVHLVQLSHGLRCFVHSYIGGLTHPSKGLTNERVPNQVVSFSLRADLIAYASHMFAYAQPMVLRMLAHTVRELCWEPIADKHTAKDYAWDFSAAIINEQKLPMKKMRKMKRRMKRHWALATLPFVVSFLRLCHSVHGLLQKGVVTPLWPGF